MEKQNAGAKLAASSRENADSIGVGLPVVVMWIATQYLGVEIPAEVAVVIGGVLGSIGAKIKRRL